MYAYGIQAPKVRWVNATTWSCDRHIPPAMIPEKMKECWYFGCTSHRPQRPEESITPLVQAKQYPSVAELALQKEQADLELIARCLKEYQGPESQPPSPESQPPSPTDADRRQGRTRMVFCHICGTPIWRRSVEVAQGKVFYCSEHRRGGKPR